MRVGPIFEWCDLRPVSAVISASEILSRYTIICMYSKVWPGQTLQFRDVST